MIVIGAKFIGLSLFSKCCPKAYSLYRFGASLSTMTYSSGAELRLSLSDLIAKTIYHFIDKEDLGPGDERENLLNAEDAAENIFEILGLQVNDGPNAEGEIETLIARSVPGEPEV